MHIAALVFHERKATNDRRNALDLIARSLLEHETISGAEVMRLIEIAKSGPSGNGLGTDQPVGAPPGSF